jgi:hypothetical protein
MRPILDEVACRWRLAGMIKRVPGYLVLAGPPNVRPCLEPGEDPVQDANPGGVPGQPLVQSDHHQPAPVRPLRVQLVKLVH